MGKLSNLHGLRSQQAPPRQGLFGKSWTAAIFALFLTLSLGISTQASAQNLLKNQPSSQVKSRTNRIVEAVPGPNQMGSHHFVRVNASKTPSGFLVPRYVSLKYGASNGRTGPSRAHPVAWRYQRKGLPMIVVAETEVWRKLRDVNGDESWMNRRLVSGKRMVLARSELVLRAKPRSSAKHKAIAAKGALLELLECDDQNWCRVREEKTHISGYALQTLLWGAQPL